MASLRRSVCEAEYQMLGTADLQPRHREEDTRSSKLFDPGDVLIRDISGSPLPVVDPVWWRGGSIKARTLTNCNCKRA